jgi:hypothetical protein
MRVSGAMIVAAVFAEFCYALASEDTKRNTLKLPSVLPFDQYGGGGAGEPGGDVLHYVCGAILVAMKTKSRRLREAGHTELAAAYEMMAGSNSFTPPSDLGVAKKLVKRWGVPFLLTLHRAGAAGQYAMKAFYRLIWNIEQCYGALLTERNLVVHAGSLVQDVHDLVLASKALKALFKQAVSQTRHARNDSCERSESFDAIEDDIWVFVTGYFFRLRGKELCGKMLSKVRQSSSSLSIRQTVAASAVQRGKKPTGAASSRKQKAPANDGSSGDEGSDDGGSTGEVGSEITDEDLAMLDLDIEAVATVI